MHTVKKDNTQVLVLKIAELREPESMAAARISLHKGEVVSIEGTDMSLHSEGGLVIFVADGVRNEIKRPVERVLAAIAENGTADRILAVLA